MRPDFRSAVIAALVAIVVAVVAAVTVQERRMRPRLAKVKPTELHLPWLGKTVLQCLGILLLIMFTLSFVSFVAELATAR